MSSDFTQPSRFPSPIDHFSLSGSSPRAVRKARRETKRRKFLAWRSIYPFLKTGEVATAFPPAIPTSFVFDVSKADKVQETNVDYEKEADDVEAEPDEVDLDSDTRAAKLRELFHGAPPIVPAAPFESKDYLNGIPKVYMADMLADIGFQMWRVINSCKVLNADTNSAAFFSSKVIQVRFLPNTRIHRLHIALHWVHHRCKANSSDLPAFLFGDEDSQDTGAESAPSVEAKDKTDCKDDNPDSKPSEDSDDQLLITIPLRPVRVRFPTIFTLLLKYLYLKDMVGWRKNWDVEYDDMPPNTKPTTVAEQLYNQCRVLKINCQDLLDVLKEVMEREK